MSPHKSVSVAMSPRKPLSGSRRKSISITISQHKPISPRKPQTSKNPIVTQSHTRKYSCPYCKKSYVSASRRTSHIRANHGLLRCLRVDYPEGDHCHDDQHGYAMREFPPSTPTSSTSSPSTSPFGRGPSIPTTIDFSIPCTSPIDPSKWRENTPSDSSFSSSSSSSSSPAATPPTRQCAICLPTLHCALPGCRARTHCHDPTHPPRRPELWSPDTAPDARVGGAHVRSAEDTLEWQSQQFHTAYGLRTFDPVDLDAALIVGVREGAPAALEWPRITQ